jgi:hypothetical protein
LPGTFPAQGSIYDISISLGRVFAGSPEHSGATIGDACMVAGGLGGEPSIRTIGDQAEIRLSCEPLAELTRERLDLAQVGQPCPISDILRGSLE